MAPKKAISDSTTATSRKLTFSHKREKMAMEPITRVVNRSNDVTLSGNDGPLRKRITTSNMDMPISTIDMESTMFTIVMMINGMHG